MPLNFHGDVDDLQPGDPLMYRNEQMESDREWVGNIARFRGKRSYDLTITRLHRLYFRNGPVIEEGTQGRMPVVHAEVYLEMK